ncbi:ribosome biogenesis GTPase Der [Phaeocystidibacter luteus]|uniref:GTPase Der n=1 Tax=Phaeocystidibacter luteus TaxID=911197 RepID=A0A6N6RKY0_9FLAO|nr:ribosome biogenesis GTPase Der [Phaeocystidibacter luteus]KAB2814059.1 ribosome biogenesis GTPase Der [Phaeocystidibacter luteus]
MPNIVAIVGRPNVGKSTLFNRLVQKRDAITDSVAGVTRDRHYGRVDWTGREFSIIDTGGYVEGSDDVFEGEIRKQVNLAIEECNLILFVVDVEMGLTEFDKEIADLLRKTKKPVVLIANKVDNPARLAEAADFYQIGMGEPFPISSINGSGTGELLDEVVKQLPKEQDSEDEEEGLPKLAIVGRPNVGKSSLVNAMFQEERNIVTDVAGTTRDTVNTRFTKFGMDFVLLDTAGLRKKTKVHEDLEFYSVMRSVRTIEHADVCLLVIDATLGIEAQDLAIFNLIQKNRKGVVVLVNKWDLLDKETNTMRDFEALVRKRLAPFVDIPIFFTSALTRQRVLKAVEEAMIVHERRITKISTSKLNDKLLPILKDNPPPMTKGKEIKIKFITQLPTHAPSFAFYANLPQYIKEPYKRYIENQMRKIFDLSGVPIQLFMRKK